MKGFRDKKKKTVKAEDQQKIMARLNSSYRIFIKRSLDELENIQKHNFFFTLGEEGEIVKNNCSSTDKAALHRAMKEKWQAQKIAKGEIEDQSAVAKNELGE